MTIKYIYLKQADEIKLKKRILDRDMDVEIAKLEVKAFETPEHIPDAIISYANPEIENIELNIVGYEILIDRYNKEVTKSENTRDSLIAIKNRVSIIDQADDYS